ncbi:MAG: amino acid ABC transporter permease [Albidovulum sp.]|nr:amino acid ABC transporter permease [Albidovulum sp.]
MDVAYMIEALPRLLPAFWVTVEVSAVSLFLAMVIGLSGGTARAFLSNRNPVVWIMEGYVGIVRCTPIIVQIYAAYLLLPKAGIRLDVFWIGVIALTFNSAGYQIEIARASIVSVGKGQGEAASALGLSKFHTILLVILPQAVRRMIPAITNEMSHLVKASAVLSVITLFELHKAANTLQATSFKFAELLALQALLYLPLILGVSRFANHLEKNVFGFEGVRAASDIR